MTTTARPQYTAATGETDPGAGAYSAPCVVTYRLISGTTLDDQVLTTPFGELRLKGLATGALAALRALLEGDVTEARTSSLVVAHDGEMGLLRWQMLRAKLDWSGLLEHAVHGERGSGHPGGAERANGGPYGP